MAIHYWMASGINQKMEKEITTSQTVRGHPFWIPKHVPNSTQLVLDHLWTSLVFLGIGLTSSIVVFFLEQLHHLYKKRVASKTTGWFSTSHISDPRSTSNKRQQEKEIKVIIYTRVYVCIARNGNYKEWEL